MTQEEMGELLLDIKGELKLINQKLDQDYKSIHGNGKPGLIDNVSMLDTRITIVETQTDTSLKWLKLCGWIISVLIAVATLYVTYRVK